MSSPSSHLPFPDFVATQERRLSSADVVVENDRGELLVLQTSYLPHWSLPGGIVDAGESPRTAAVRELHEETGLSCQTDDLVFSALIHRRVAGVDIYVFIFRLITPFDERHQLRIDDDEIVAIDWVSANDVRQEVRGRYNHAVRNWASDAPQVYLEDQESPPID